MARVPRRLPGDPKLPLSSGELHLLECIDGSFDVEALAFTSGRDPAEVEAMLARLVEAHLVSFDAKPAPKAAQAKPTYGDDVDLPHEVRKQVDELFARLEGANHYEVLGVPRTATKDQIRDAYYKVGPRFHPDRHFRKKLGPYKARIEAVFAAYTKAHDTLRFEAKRAAYDATLAPVRSAAPATARPSVTPTAARVGPVTPATVTVETEEQRRARRDALARKLGAAEVAPRANSAPATSRPPGDSVPPPSTGASASSYRAVEGVQQSAAEMIRARFEKAGGNMREKRIRRYLESADDAMNLGDFRTAAAAFEQATKLDPEDQDIRAKLEQARKLAGMA
ncbi:MAG: DnaJ domain-containing protein [Deltaproteobacteria bacterium]|nr:DnaJ domain-containing protein [Deltaproteobacteria bacterium]